MYVYPFEIYGVVMECIPPAPYGQSMFDDWIFGTDLPSDMFSWSESKPPRRLLYPHEAQVVLRGTWKTW